MNEIILTEQGQPDVLHEGRQVLSSGFSRVLDPGDDTFKHLKVMKLMLMYEVSVKNHHLLLVGHGDGVTGNEGGDLVWTETVELVALEHLKQLI